MAYRVCEGLAGLRTKSSTNVFPSYCLRYSGSNGLIFTKAVPKFWNNISIYFRKIFVLIYSFVGFLRTPQQSIQGVPRVKITTSGECSLC